MNGKDSEESNRGLILELIPKFAWRGKGEPRKSSVPQGKYQDRLLWQIIRVFPALVNCASLSSNTSDEKLWRISNVW
jgi:hypothetical protein